ncbi:glucosamine-6-phosphate deaminase [Mycoplasmatota bacterium WC44]
MEVIVVDNYDKLSKKAFEIVKESIINKPNANLGLATGSTPLGLYKEMVKEFENSKTSYKNVKTFNLDEYIGLSQDNEQSYFKFMRNNLFDYIDIDFENTYIPFGTASNVENECVRYNTILEENIVDLQVLGIGVNGHIGFNEPGSLFYEGVHVVKLDERTRNDNARFFESKNQVPTSAITMGIKNILSCKKILLLASGKAKAKAIYEMIHGDILETMPASALRVHPNVVIIVDKEAASLL